MANIFDVSKYILNAIGGDISTMQLQKLCFYSQAIHLSKNEKSLFDEKFEAWANGPVSRDLFNVHKGKFVINNSFIRNELLTNKFEDLEIASINECIEMYGNKTGAELSEISHSEFPWINARGNVPEGVKCTKIISDTSIKDFYNF